MKKVYHHLKGILFGYPKRSTLLDGFLRKKITVVYPKCLVNGILREETVKVWDVAISHTAEPTIGFKTHAEWMVMIMIQRSDCISAIAEAEYNEINHAIKSYHGKNKLHPILLANHNN